MWVFYAESAHTKGDPSLPLITSWHLENCQGFLQDVNNMFKKLPLYNTFFFSNIFFHFTVLYSAPYYKAIKYFGLFFLVQKGRVSPNGWASQQSQSKLVLNINLDLLTSDPTLHEVYIHLVENTATIKIFHIICKNAL